MIMNIVMQKVKEPKKKIKYNFYVYKIFIVKYLLTYSLNFKKISNSSLLVGQKKENIFNFYFGRQTFVPL